MPQTLSMQRPMDLNAVQTLIKTEMHQVNEVINQHLCSDVGLVKQLGNYIIGGGGKRLRPMLTLLCARACGYQGQNHIQVAAIIEFIHTATLLHDDVVDASTMRRGKKPAHEVWGNEATVLVGDFLYSRAFQMMVDIDQMQVMDILAKTTNTIAEGEIMQLLSRHDPNITEEQYIHIIQSKTAKLFEAAARLGAILGHCNQETEQAISSYGRHLGIAFQLIDDSLDYDANVQDVGKNIGDDLAEGKPTLPLIHAIKTGNTQQRQQIKQAITNGGLEDIDRVIHIITATQSIAYTRELAHTEKNRALSYLSCLETTRYQQALVALANFSVKRVT